jgi:hypothetical protein
MKQNFVQTIQIDCLGSELYRELLTALEEYIQFAVKYCMGKSET